MTERLVTDESQIPTRELQRAQRKKAYETAKANRKAKKREDKAAAAAEKADEQRKKDEMLWNSLLKASSIKKDPEK